MTFLASLFVLCMCLLEIRCGLHQVNDIVNIKVIKTGKLDIGRYKRHTGDMPSDLHVEVISSHATSRLRLKRSPLLPAITFKDGRKIVDDSPILGQAVYSDRSRRAAFLVKRNAGDYHLHGNFHHGDQYLTIKPHHSITKRSEGTHVITRREDLGNLEQQLREKRASTNINGNTAIHTIETLFISDFQDYDAYMMVFGDEMATTAGMRLEYSFIRDNMQIRFDNVNNVDPTIQIIVAVKDFVIIKDQAQNTFFDNLVTDNRINIGEALPAFQSFLASPPAGITLTPSDHYMIFTGHDLAMTGNLATTGTGVNEGLCDMGPPINSLSIIESKRNIDSATIAAHELAHNMGAVDDGQGTAASCPDTNFVMTETIDRATSPDTASNIYWFSSCSVADMKAFLSGPDVTCTSEDTIGDGILTVSERAGQLVNADDQCRRAVADNGSFFCRNLYFSSPPEFFSTMCLDGMCFNPIRGTCDSITFQEFTTCGNQMWCVQGVCMPDAEAPVVRDLCPQGERPRFDCTLPPIPPELGPVCELVSDSFRADCCEQCVDDITTSTTTSTTSTTTTTTTTTTTPTTTPTTTTTTTTPTTTPTTTTTTTTPTTIPTTTTTTTTPTTTTATTPTTTTTTKMPPTPSRTTTSVETTTAKCDWLRFALGRCDRNSYENNDSDEWRTTRRKCTLKRFVKGKCNKAKRSKWYYWRSCYRQGTLTLADLNNQEDNDSNSSDSNERKNDKKKQKKCTLKRFVKGKCNKAKSSKWYFYKKSYQKGNFNFGRL